MTDPHSIAHPFRAIRRRDLVIVREVAAIQHRLLDASTWLGMAWSLLNPILLLGVLYAFFSQRVGAEIEHYALYLLIGLVQMTHFSKSTAAAMRSVHAMRSLAANVIFPKDVLVYSAILSGVREFSVSMLVAAAVALLTGVRPSAALIALPFVVALQLLLVLWVSLVLAVLHVFLRDIEHLFDVAMRLLFFVTPVIYSVNSLSPRLQRIAMLNPLAHVMSYARAIIIDGHAPLGPMAVFGAVNLVLVYLAVAFFRYAEPAIMDEL